MKSFLFIYLLLTLEACHKNDKVFFEKKLKENLFDVYDIEVIIVLPGTGCSGCVLGAEDFIRRNATQLEKVKFVLTSIESLKILRLKLGEEVLNLNNIFLDIENKMYNIADDRSIYPTILYLQDSKLKSVDYISPGSKLKLEEILKKYKVKTTIHTDS